MGKGDHGVVDEEKGFRYYSARSPHPSDGFPAEIDRCATAGHLPRWGRLSFSANTLRESSCLKFFAELSFKKATNTKRKLTYNLSASHLGTPLHRRDD